MKGKQSFAMLRKELLESNSWKSLSINGHRLVDFLIIEHLKKGGKENGNLKAPYNQLEEYGIPRRLINSAISELETFGLILVERGGRMGNRNYNNTFTITFLVGSKVRKTPSDEWKKVTMDEISKFKERHKKKSMLLVDNNQVSQSNHTILH